MGNICAKPQGKFDIVCLGKSKSVSVEHFMSRQIQGNKPFKICQKRYAVKIVPSVSELRELGSAQYHGSRPL